MQWGKNGQTFPLFPVFLKGASPFIRADMHKGTAAKGNQGPILAKENLGRLMLKGKFAILFNMGTSIIAANQYPARRSNLPHIAIKLKCLLHYCSAVTALF